MNRYKSDWTEARERLLLWWAGEKTDRVVAQVTAPRRGVTPRPGRDEVPGKYTDAAVVFHNVDARLASTFYGGEAIPEHWVYLGPVPLGGYMGCEMRFEPDTVWQSPRYDSWDEFEMPTFDPSNRWYRLLCELTEASARRARGEYFVSGQGFGCASDIIANMWGSESTLTAMVERRDTVRAVMQALTVISKNLYDEVDAITSPYQEGSFDWIHLWAPGRQWTLQSDLCCMVSPQMFEDLILDELRQEAEHVDYSLYHLDGPDAIKHLDALLSIDALDGIQWVPGAGTSTDPMDWIDMFRRVQAAGKKLLIYSPPDRIKPLFDKISKRNVCLNIRCPDQDSAEQVLSDLDRMGI